MRERKRGEEQLKNIAGMLILVGFGLGNPKDITINGLEAVQSADLVYLESYTSIMCDSVDLKQLVSTLITVINVTHCNPKEEILGREVTIADRDMVEADDNEIISNSKKKDIVLLVVGDPLGYAFTVVN